VRIVLDPNVLISAALSSQGPSAQILREAREGSFEPVVCPALLGELGLAGLQTRSSFVY
jgi:predicted nucleic acid-binding protein